MLILEPVPMRMCFANGAAVGEGEGMRIDEACVSADDVELGGCEGLLAVGGKLADDFFLSRMDGLHVGASGGDFQSEGFSFLSEMQNLGHVEKRLRWHATAENAEAAEFFGAVNDGGAEAERDRDAGGIEAGTAAAEDEEIVGFHRGNFGETGDARRWRERRQLSTGVST